MKSNIVITMAGNGSRFREAGFELPKYEITAHGKTLFEWSMLSLKNFISSDCQVIFVCLETNDAEKFVRTKCEMLGISQCHIVQLNSLTAGQATSAFLSRDLWRDNEPLLVYNIDTCVNPDALLPTSIRPGSDGWVPCFQVPGVHWSFVKLGDDGWAVDLEEKIRISEYASIGLYWFNNSGHYSAAYEKFYSDQRNNRLRERYIAPLYKQLILQGAKVSISDLSPDNVHALGTPSELNDFVKSYGKGEPHG